MPLKHAADQSQKRRWSRLQGDSYMFSVRIKEPQLTEFRQFCERTGLTPSDAMRTALNVYMDPKVRRKMRQRIDRYEKGI